MTMNLKLLHQAVDELARRCDGAHFRDEQGFNKPDSYAGRFLAAVPVNLWTPNMIWQAWHMLRKYQEQLATYGIEYEEIGRPETLPDDSRSLSLERRRLLHYEEGYFILTFNYDPALNFELQVIDGAHWREEKSAWFIPGASWQQLLDFVKEHAFLPTTAAQDALNDIDRVLAEWNKLVAEGRDVPSASYRVEWHEDQFRIYFPKQAHNLRKKIKERVPNVSFKWKSNPYWSAPHSAGQSIEALIKEYPEFEVSEAAQEAIAIAPAPYRIEYRNNTFLIFFPKNDQQLLGAVRNLPDRKFDTDHWEVPFNSGCFLLPLCREWPFEVTAEVRQTMENAPHPYRIEYDVDGFCFRVYFPGNDWEVGDEVKRIVGRQFVDEPPHYQIPQHSVDQILDLVSTYGSKFEIPVAMHEQMKSLEQERQRIIAASCAKDANVTLPSGFGGTLKPFQRAAVAYYQQLPHGQVLLGDSMGLGKTVEALAILHIENAFPALIVCPMSLKINWKRHVEKFLPGRTVEVVNSGEDPAGWADVIIINYDLLSDGWDESNGGKKEVILSRYVKAIGHRNFQAIVLDESHYVKSDDAQRSKACEKLAEGVPVRLLLTGTPLVNRPLELVQQLKIMGQLDNFGGFMGFAFAFCNPKSTPWGWDFSGASNLSALNERLRSTCMVRRTKEEVLDDLDPIQWPEIYVEINNRQEYEQAEKNLMAWLREQAVEEVGFLESIKDLPQERQNFLRWQHGNDVVAKAMRAEALRRIGVLRLLAAQGKIPAAIEWIENFLEKGKKLVVFGWHREIVEAIGRYFDAPFITGDTPINVRQEYVDRFQNDPDCRLIVGNLQTISEGLTLTAASDVLFLEMAWTPARQDQAASRVHRIGQVEARTNAWLMLADDTIDEMMAHLIASKREVISSATGDLTGNEQQADIDNSVISELISQLLGKGE